ncbi:MAG: DUF554 domain-containing protein [Oscillospiraceae bacterium]|nr:DUF554 domain-containing protein [Oscillospiraceae bacterium]
MIPIRITGAVINAFAILIGSGIGLLLMGRISDRFAKNIHRALGLCVCIIGISGALGGDVMLLVVAMALGTLFGELLRIDDGLNRLGKWAQTKLSREGEQSTFAEGFVTATLLFCVGAMAVVGSIDSGLRDDQNVILTKSMIDGAASIILASTLGFGVLFSAFMVLLYQGGIEFFAGFLQNVFTDGLIMQIAAIGGVMIFGIGLNMTLDTKIKVANFLPGFLVAVGYYFLILR